MPVATEIVLLRLKSGVNPENASSPAAAQLKQTCATVSQQQGFIRQYWGVQVEDPSVFVWTLDWESVEDHKNFINSAAYGPFIAGMVDLFDFEVAKPYIVHAHFTSDASAVREAPVTEFTFFMMPKGATNEQKSSLEDAFLKIVQLCITKKTAFQGYALGWVVEDVDHEAAKPDGKATALVAVIGWPSVEDHHKIREHEEILDTAKAARGLALPSKPGQGVFHVKLHGKS